MTKQRWTPNSRIGRREFIKLAGFGAGAAALAACGPAATQVVSQQSITIRSGQRVTAIRGIGFSPVVALIDAGTAGASEVVASAIIERNRGQVVGEKSFGAGAEQQLFTLRGGDGLLLTTVKWATSSGKTFLGEDRAHSGVTPSVEVKGPEVADNVDPDDLSGNDDDAAAKPDQNNEKREGPAQPAAKPAAEDLQMKKALELLRDKPAQLPKAA